MIIRSFYDIADRLELAQDLSVKGRPANFAAPLAPGFFSGTPERHVFVVPSKRGPCLGFNGHLLILDAGTRLALRQTGQGRFLVIARGDDVLAEIPAPEPDDYVDDDDEMNDFFVWLVGRFNTAEARAAYTV
ncbi:hypothetical protein SAZ10_27115 [Mesorhizobium sp. BAC0120]|uniref:hypothetical protein n=1 Tax=Mesorhizobium sp. BAC0120 TaxID=3090670 RepID=UPI00298C66D6|nr:hypothetical protein [Mesorhizobium sp. BAC0120]MDW6025438.1 hypothetical protein [Mesorhizobium sp. BAC0120]